MGHSYARCWGYNNEDPALSSPNSSRESLQGTTTAKTLTLSPFQQFGSTSFFILNSSLV